MQNHQDRLKIHTSVRPAAETKEGGAEQNIGEKREGVCEAPLPAKAEKRKKHPDTARKQRRREIKDGATVGEKLLRNTAVACALMLSVMALKNVDQPWSRKVTEGVKQAMTMRIDWDETLGRLSFVRSLMPETALVFLNLGGQAELSAPVSGEITHEYTDQQPWLEYGCGAAQPVYSAMQGAVTAVGEGAGGDWIVLIRDSDGRETVYGYLANVYVEVGQAVEAGQQIGATADEENSRLYFELRENGEAADPTARIG